MDTATRQVLLNMKARLSQGWVQKGYWEGEGACLFGALINVGNVPFCKPLESGRPSAEGRGRSRLRDGESAYVIIDESPEGKAIEILAEQAGVSWVQLANWNDAPERTQEDVVGLIDAALAAHPVAEEVGPIQRAVGVLIHGRS